MLIQLSYSDNNKRRQQKEGKNKTKGQNKINNGDTKESYTSYGVNVTYVCTTGPWVYNRLFDHDE